MRSGVVQPYVYAWRTSNAMTCHPKVAQRADDSLLNAVDILLDKVAGPAEVNQGIGDNLARSMKSDLAAPVALHHRNVARAKQVIGFASEALCVNRVVFAEPQGIRRCVVAFGSEGLHGRISVLVIDATEILNKQ